MITAPAHAILISLNSSESPTNAVIYQVTKFPRETFSSTMETRMLFFLAMFLITKEIFMSVVADIVEGKESLLNFLRNISHSHLLNWNKDYSL